jgi:hypothetical protein
VNGSSGRLRFLGLRDHDLGHPVEGRLRHAAIGVIARGQQELGAAGTGAQRHHDVERLLRQVDVVGLARLHAALRDRPDGVLEVDLVPGGLDELALAHEREQDQAQRQANGRQRRRGVEHAVHDADLGRRQRSILGHERRDRRGADFVRGVRRLVAMQCREAEHLLDDVAHVHGGGRRAAFLDLAHRLRRSSGPISASSRLRNTGMMSRSMMLLRIDLVLSAILASSSQRLVNCSKVLASAMRRFSRCFSWLGD